MRKMAGYSLLEVLFVISAALIVSGIAAPPFLAGLDEYRTAGAVRYLAARIQRTRMEAVNRSTNTAMRFVKVGTHYVYRIYVDGNGDGVRTEDISSGVDRPLGAVERLADNHAGVDLAVLPGLPAVEPGSLAPGTDPVKLGSSSLLSYAPTGSSSSGSLYILGRGRVQYVIRIQGDTGRTRILKFESRSRRWKPL
jgi:type II secretory pathway pseudopilin PulG